MKRYEFEVKEFDLQLFFPEHRLKHKTHLINILLEACRFMLVQKPSENVESENKIVLNIDKMSRIFFFRKNKYYTIFFPFNVLEEEENDISFNYKNILNIDSESISALITIIKDDQFNSSSCLDFADPIDSLENQLDSNFWIVLRDLIFAEEGYLRYDVDLEGWKKAKEKEKEHTHPEHHFDIFYTNTTSVKFGLVQKLLENEFIESVNIQSDCLYLRRFQE
ncbi:hypothetical protein VS868_11795 [Salinimicrobium sp. 3283s]|uniref:hypothetical protein n=1 Tax=Salinimicrobium sp. 3283s TaxID=3114359 RepID=UPI0031EDDD58